MGCKTVFYGEPPVGPFTLAFMGFMQAANHKISDSNSLHQPGRSV